MKLFLSVLVLHSFFMSSPALAASSPRSISSSKPAVTSAESTTSLEYRATNELSDLYSQKLTASLLLSKIQNRISEDHLSFLRNKSLGLKGLSFSVEKMGAQEFLIKTDTAVTYVILQDFEKGLFQINGKTVTVDVKGSAEAMWRSVLPALHGTGKVSLWEVLFLEQAHAMDFAALLMGIAVVGIIGYMYNKSNCSQYDSYAAQCALAQSNPSAVNSADLYYQARTFDSSWTNLSMGCHQSKAQVRACIPAISNSVGPAVQ